MTAPTPASQAVEAPVSLTAIKPCPFCGGRGITYRASMPQQWAVSCTQCDCRPRIGWPTSEAEAITAWNAREYDERLKRLELMRLDAMAMEDNAALVEQTIRSECDARQAVSQPWVEISDLATKAAQSAAADFETTRHPIDLKLAFATFEQTIRSECDARHAAAVEAIRERLNAALVEIQVLNKAIAINSMTEADHALFNAALATQDSRTTEESDDAR
jgi:Lar family restriction alleviation protein